MSLLLIKLRFIVRHLFMPAGTEFTHEGVPVSRFRFIVLGLRILEQEYFDDINRKN